MSSSEARSSAGTRTPASWLRPVVAVLGLLAATRRTGSIIYCWVLFVGFTGMTAYGILATALVNPEDPINLNWADNWLHGLTAAAGLVLGIVAARAVNRTAVRSR